MKKVLAAAAVLLALSGGLAASATSASAAPAPLPASTAGVTLPPANGRFDYQIGGAYRPAASVQIVDRDRHDAPVAGKYNICYVNGFQTQGEDKTFWLQQHPDLVLTINGKPVRDPGWPDEYILDLTTAAKRQAIAAIVGPWIAQCAADGYQAVEPDNLDSWTRSKKAFGKDEALAYATLLVQVAHQHGLAIGQKNANALGTSGRDVAGFDFAIAEECEFYRECNTYTSVYGNQVYEVEYSDQAKSAYTRACKNQGQQISVIYRDRDVTPRGDDAYVYQAC